MQPVTKSVTREASIAPRAASRRAPTVARPTVARPTVALRGVAGRTALGLAVLVLVGIATGCRTTSQTEKPFTITIDAAGAAPVTAACASAPESAPRSLGKAPITIDRLVIVRWRSISGETRYFLREDGASLPPNATKPAFTDPAFVAGHDEPLDLRFSAAGGASAALRIDAALLERCFADPSPSVNVRLAATPARPPTPPAPLK